MPDENVDKWKQEGRLYLWRYTENTRNYPGWHLTADDACCHSLADLIERMLSARWSSQKPLVLTPPTKEVLRVPNNRGGEARWKSPAGLILKYPKGKVGDEHIALETNIDTIILSVGKLKLELLRRVCAKSSEGRRRLFYRGGEYAAVVLVDAAAIALRVTRC